MCFAVASQSRSPSPIRRAVSWRRTLNDDGCPPWCMHHCPTDFATKNHNNLPQRWRWHLIPATMTTDVHTDHLVTMIMDCIPPVHHPQWHNHRMTPSPPVLWPWQQWPPPGNNGIPTSPNDSCALMTVTTNTCIHRPSIFNGHSSDHHPSMMVMATTIPSNHESPYTTLTPTFFL